MSFPQASPKSNARLPEGLRVSAYDRVAGVLISLLVIVGFGVLVLVLLWLASRAMTGSVTPPVELLEERPAGGDTLGTSNELEEPGVEEFAEMEAPQLADTLAAVTTVVTTQQAALEDLMGASDAVGTGSGEGSRQAIGSGGDGNVNVVPRWERWKIRYATGSVTQYARQLDFFGVELAALGGGRDGVVYAAGLANGNPTTREGTGEDEQRLRFTWEKGTLQEFDRHLLAAAGVDVSGRIVAQFMPAEIENRLAILERDHSEGRDLEEIHRTVFGVQSAGDGYEFYVLR